MRDRKWTRREVSKTPTAVAAGVLFADPNGRAAAECRAAVPEFLLQRRGPTLAGR